MRKIIFFGMLLVQTTVLLLTGCRGSGNALSSEQIASMKAQLDELLTGQRLTDEYLVKFDTLDFVVYSKQEWARLHESHDENIKVYWPDGHFTVGLPRHIEDLKGMFVWAPDTKITEHPIRFGSGKYTGVTGYMEGTFTRPMPVEGGKHVNPTGKQFKVPMCTIGIWENGVMIEEHLFWDNQTLMQQTGAGR